MRAHYTPADRELAQWALDAWRRAAGPALRLTPAPETSARVRLYWAGPLSGHYGEMRALRVGGQTGAAVYIRPDTAALGPDIHALASSDPLFRDAVVVSLTCLHELGHAFGLEHTAEFGDIMYSFQFGGDLVEYFRPLPSGIEGQRRHHAPVWTLGGRCRDRQGPLSADSLVPEPPEGITCAIPIESTP